MEDCYFMVFDVIKWVAELGKLLYFFIFYA